jgi:hypothetical protein
MKYVIIGHPIQIKVSHIQPFVYAAWQRLLCSALIYGIQLPACVTETKQFSDR